MKQNLIINLKLIKLKLKIFVKNLPKPMKIMLSQKLAKKLVNGGRPSYRKMLRSFANPRKDVLKNPWIT
jgi:hypothetical protein